VTPRTARRTVFMVLFALVSCSVYDSSLLGGGGGSSSSGGGGSGNNGGTIIAGTESEDAGAGNSGTAGTSTTAGTGGTGGVSGSTNGGTENMGGEPPMGGDAGNGNDGGAGSSGGGAGGTVAGGGAGNGGKAGSGGTSGAGGSGGSTSATGCAKLSVPLDATGDRSHFVISLTNTQDLTTGTISLRFYVQAGAAGSILPYVQDPNFAFLGRPPADLTTFSGWSTITWDVAAEPTTGNITKNSIKRIGIEITANPAASGWSNPTVVYLDSVRVKMATFAFDSSDNISTLASTTDQGNQVLWFNNNASDSTATGALTWQATCP
jgi:hypothetical protein